MHVVSSSHRRFAIRTLVTGHQSRSVRTLAAWPVSAHEVHALLTAHPPAVHRCSQQWPRMSPRQPGGGPHCHSQGGGCVQALRQQCMVASSCSAFVTRPAHQKVPASGWLKTGPINSSCTSVSPYTALYVRQGWPLPAPPASGSTPVGAIVGGTSGCREPESILFPSWGRA